MFNSHKLLLAGAALLAIGATYAVAQSPPRNNSGYANLVVATCGNQTFVAGTYAPSTVDVTGKFCTSQ